MQKVLTNNIPDVTLSLHHEELTTISIFEQESSLNDLFHFIQKQEEVFELDDFSKKMSKNNFQII